MLQKKMKDEMLQGLRIIFGRKPPPFASCMTRDCGFSSREKTKTKVRLCPARRSIGEKCRMIFSKFSLNMVLSSLLDTYTTVKYVKTRHKRYFFPEL